MTIHASLVGRLAATLLMVLGSWAGAAEAQELSYRYVSLDAAMPEGVEFFEPVAVTNGGRVYGAAFTCVTPECENIVPHVAVYKDGAVTLLQPGLPLAVNDAGTMGGAVLDPVNFFDQAAIFRGAQLELVPRLPGEISSFVVALNDSGSALVASFNANFEQAFVLYKNGESTVLDFGPEVTNVFEPKINNAGVISGTQGSDLCDGATAFRFNTHTGELELLEPLASEPAGWGMDINNRGNVLGYSFVCGGFERVGLWNRRGEFQTWFVEGTEEFPTISNELLFNDNNLIVITSITSPNEDFFRHSYLVPRPGVRLDLTELVANPPAGFSPSLIRDINNHGDMIGLDFLTGGAYLLERVQ